MLSATPDSTPPLSSHPCRTRSGFTVVEVMVTVVVILALTAVGFSLSNSIHQKAQLAKTAERLRGLGEALVTYTEDSNGKLPYEDSAGPDDWSTAASPENKDVWYNALPKIMGQPAVGELGSTPEAFYQEEYPLFIPGAPYPPEELKIATPHFAIAMNSRLQRKDEKGVKEQGLLNAISEPARTVAFLERGMAGDKKTHSAQKGFSGSPKANPRAFAARHNQKGLLIFIDGHVEKRAVSELIDREGTILYPQTDIVWTTDPEEDPN